MALFIGGISAFTFWRAQSRPLPTDAFCTECFDCIPTPTAHEISAIDLGLRELLGGTLHVYAGDDRKRHCLEHAHMHTLSGSQAATWFAKVAPEVYLASPELCFAQAADYLTPLQLAKWGMELCGRYRFDSQQNAFVQRNAALMSTRSLLSFLAAYGGKPGAKRARRAAGWLMDGSASLRESQLALHLRIPRRSGGNGVGIPLLNHRIDLDPEMQKIAGQSCYYVDEFWPDHLLALEYDSDAFHNSPEQVALDRKRRNIIQRLGIRVITVNTRQLTDLREIDDIAAQILEHMHKRQKSIAREWQKRHRLFHNELMCVDRKLHL